jgi:hypothetical protein
VTREVEMPTQRILVGDARARLAGPPKRSV